MTLVVEKPGHSTFLIASSARRRFDAADLVRQGRRCSAWWWSRKPGRMRRGRGGDGPNRRSKIVLDPVSALVRGILRNVVVCMAG